MDFNEANKVEHKTEDQWHYPIMINHGWIPDTLKGIGFVRSYNYHHQNSNVKIIVTTGCNSDYWSAMDDRKEVASGLWSGLEYFVKNFNSKNNGEAK